MSAHQMYNENMANNAEDAKAIELIDKAITEISGRDLVSSGEMTDLLLDIRLYLITNEVGSADNNR
jgi:hypothetical protein